MPLRHHITTTKRRNVRPLKDKKAGIVHPNVHAIVNYDF